MFPHGTESKFLPIKYVQCEGKTGMCVALPNKGATRYNSCCAGCPQLTTMNKKFNVTDGPRLQIRLNTEILVFGLLYFLTHLLGEGKHDLTKELNTTSSASLPPNKH